MANSTVATAIDSLLAMIRALPACALPVIVFDGIPGPGQPNQFVCVGGLMEPEATSSQAWAGLGAMRRDEWFDCVLFITSWVGGNDAQGATGVSDAQKTARDQTYVITHAIEDALRADPTLGGIVLWCEVTSIRTEETSMLDGEEGSGMGRLCDAHMNVHFRNLI